MRVAPIPVLLLAAWIPASLAAAPIENPDFTSDLSGWVDEANPAVTWLASDLDGCPGSGSMHLEHEEIFPVGAAQCVAFETTEAFTVEAIVSAPSLAPAEFAAFAYAGQDCTGAQTILFTEIANTAEPTRVQLHFDGAGSIQSVNVQLAALARLEIPETMPNATYDAIRIHPGDAVFLDGFEAGALCRWSGSISGFEP